MHILHPLPTICIMYSASLRLLAVNQIPTFSTPALHFKFCMYNIYSNNKLKRKQSLSDSMKFIIELEGNRANLKDKFNGQIYMQNYLVRQMHVRVRI